MSEENLWGEIAVPENQRTPVAILREQASILSQLTKGILVASVTPVQSSAPNQLIYSFELKAPALNNYVMTILSIHHPITIYPLTFVNRVKGGQTQCNTEEEFLKALKEVLSSPDVKRVISALMVQSRELKKGL